MVNVFITIPYSPIPNYSDVFSQEVCSKNHVDSINLICFALLVCQIPEEIITAHLRFDPSLLNKCNKTMLRILFSLPISRWSLDIYLKHGKLLLTLANFSSFCKMWDMIQVLNLAADSRPVLQMSGNSRHMQQKNDLSSLSGSSKRDLPRVSNAPPTLLLIFFHV